MPCKLRRKLVFIFSLAAHASLHLADLLPHLLGGPGFAEVILGTSAGRGVQPPNFPGNWKQVRPGHPQRLPPRLAWAP